MFNPFILFKKEYINGLINRKKVYLVTQTFTRAIPMPNATNNLSILITTYDDIGLAKIHFTAVRNDKYAAVLHLQNKAHYTKLEQILQPESRYNLYWSIVQNAESVRKRLSLKYRDHIRRYIQKNTNWLIGGEQKITPQLSCIFGELFIILTWGSQQLRIKFTEIEKA